MAKKEKRTARNAPRRTETVSIRLDPRLRYLAELAARQQRRTISSYCEWAIEESLKNVEVDANTSVMDAADELWNPIESDRFARLAFRYPHLLTHEEHVLWRKIVNNNYFSQVREEEVAVGNAADGRPIVKRMPVVRVGEATFNLERLRAEWPKYLAVARGEASEDILPKPLELGVHSFEESRKSTVRLRRRG
jgi:hypothetical protein